MRVIGAAPVGFTTEPVAVIVQTSPFSVPEYVTLPPSSWRVVEASSDPVSGFRAVLRTESACPMPASASVYAVADPLEALALRAFAVE